MTVRNPVAPLNNDMLVEDLDNMDFDSIAATSSEQSLAAPIVESELMASAPSQEQTSIPASSVSLESMTLVGDDVVSLLPDDWSDEVTKKEELDKSVASAPTDASVGDVVVPSASAPAPALSESVPAAVVSAPVSAAQDLSEPVSLASVAAPDPTSTPSVFDLDGASTSVQTAKDDVVDVAAAGSGIGGSSPTLIPLTAEQDKQMQEAVDFSAKLKPSIKISPYDRPSNFGKLNDFIQRSDHDGLKAYLSSDECETASKNDTSTGVFAAVARSILSDPLSDKDGRLKGAATSFEYLVKEDPVTEKDKDIRLENEAGNIAQACSTLDETSREAGVQFLRDNMAKGAASKDKAPDKKPAAKADDGIDFGDWKQKLTTGGMKMAALACLFLPGGVFLTIGILAILPDEKKKEVEQAKDASAAGVAAPGKGHEAFMTPEELASVGRGGASASKAPTASVAPVSEAVASVAPRGAVGTALDGVVADGTKDTTATAQQLVGLQDQLRQRQTTAVVAAPSIEAVISAPVVSAPMLAIEDAPSEPTISTLAIVDTPSEPAASTPVIAGVMSVSAASLEMPAMSVPTLDVESGTIAEVSPGPMAVVSSPVSLAPTHVNETVGVVNEDRESMTVAVNEARAGGVTDALGTAVEHSDHDAVAIDNSDRGGHNAGMVAG